MSYRVALESDLAPEEALLALRGDERSFALVGDWAGGGALLGSAPIRVLDAHEDPFAVLGALGSEEGDAVVGGGWFGTLGYGLGALVEHLPAPPPAPVRRRRTAWPSTTTSCASTASAGGSNGSVRRSTRDSRCGASGWRARRRRPVRSPPARSRQSLRGRPVISPPSPDA